jgi:hypothetical protein
MDHLKSRDSGLWYVLGGVEWRTESRDKTRSLMSRLGARIPRHPKAVRAALERPHGDGQGWRQA